jgi:hypothetical protein
VGDPQQLSGGIAAGIGGLIIVQNSQTHIMARYDTLGYITVVTVTASIFALSRVNKLLAVKTTSPAIGGSADQPYSEKHTATIKTHDVKMVYFIKMLITERAVSTALCFCL